MLTHWNKLINTDCKVYELGNHFVYPIMRNGSTSLRAVVGKKYENQQISQCTDMLIFIRDPAERFVSGLKEYCKQNDKDVIETLALVRQGKVIDRHFSPQWIWLLHLSKFYTGKVKLLHVDELHKYCDKHLHKSKHTPEDIMPLDEFVRADMELIKQIGQTIELETLVRKCKNVLS